MATKQLQKEATKATKINLKLSIVEYIRANKKLPTNHYSHSSLDYYTKQLRSDGILIKKGYGVWDIDESKFSDYSRKELQIQSDKTTSNSSKSGHSLIRGHGHQFYLEVPKIIDWSRRKTILDKANIPYEIKGDGSYTIRIYGHKCHLVDGGIIVYFSESKSFYGNNAQKSENKAVYEFVKVITRIGNKIGFDLSHKGKLKFSIDKAHYAEIENELAIIYNNEREKFHVVGEDGKIWCLIDFSNKVNELETIHPQRSKEDMNKLQPFFNDLRRNELPLYSELVKSHAMTLETLNNMANLQNNAQIEIQALCTTLNRLITPMEIKDMPKEQKTIPEYIG